jgi:tight adherence protein B
VLEAGFAVLIAATMMLFMLVGRASLSRGKEKERRLSGDSGESGVGLQHTSFLAGPPPGTRSRFDQWFETAVLRSGLKASPPGVVAFMLLLGIALGGGLFLWKERIWLAGFGLMLGVGLPLAVVALAHRRYRRKLQSQLPEAFRMLAGSVRAGQTIEQAVEFYAERGVKPLADEFAHAAALMRLGMSPYAALQSTATRVRLLDFDLLVSTVGLYTQTGGNLVLLMERLAESVRDRNQFQSQFFAATAQARIVAIAIGAAGPALFVVYILADPEHVQTFLESSRGWFMLGMCALLETIGVIWLWQILKIDY